MPRLHRRLSPLMLAVYGVGGMLGGGIYALVGPVAAQSPTRPWLPFLVAMLVATPTALVYAELAARYPRSGGESWYVQLAFGRESLAQLVGWLVLFSGLVSMATLSTAFAGHARELGVALPDAALELGFLVVLGLVNARGIGLTTRANLLCTVVELGGLLVVIAVAAWALAGDGPAPAPAANADPAPVAASGVLAAAALAFYAFIGFEDLANVAEEVREPQRAYPRALPLALVLVGATYMAVTALATHVVPAAELGASEAPLVLVVERATGANAGRALAAVALFAVANSALLNFVMASRLAYGMGRERLLPPWLAAVHPRRRTPHRAVLVVGVLAAAFALSGTLEVLAATTSTLLLAVFATVCAAHLALRRRRPASGFRVPLAVPAIGVLVSLGLAAFVEPTSALLALGVAAAGLALVPARRLWNG